MRTDLIEVDGNVYSVGQIEDAFAALKAIGAVALQAISPDAALTRMAQLANAVDVNPQ